MMMTMISMYPRDKLKTFFLKSMIMTMRMVMMVETLLFAGREVYPLLEASDSFHSMATLFSGDDEDGNGDDDDDDEGDFDCDDHSDFCSSSSSSSSQSAITNRSVRERARPSN